LFDQAIYLAMMMLARCGMRINEPLRLCRHHYRADEGSVYIERTKFRKDRLIPLPKAFWLNSTITWQHAMRVVRMTKILSVGRKKRSTAQGATGP
jgi:integrase